MYERSDEGVENGDREEGSEISRRGKIDSLLYEEDLALYGESEEDLKAMMEWFVEVCRR